MSLLDASQLEGDLKDLLRHKDYELDERGKLLQTSKDVIEKLQQELLHSRRDAEELERKSRYKDQLLERQQRETSALQDRCKTHLSDLDYQKNEILALQSEVASRASNLQHTKSEFQTFREKTREDQRRAEEVLNQVKEELRTQSRHADAAEAEVGRLLQEIEVVRGKCTAFETGLRDRDSQVKACKEQILLLEGALDEEKSKLAEEEGRSRDLNAQLVRTGRDLQDSREEAKALQKAIDQLRHEKQGLTRERDGLQGTKDDLLLDLQATRAELGQTQASLAAKAKELEGSSALAERRASEMDRSEAKWADNLRQATSRFEESMMDAEREWGDKAAQMERDWAHRLEQAERRFSAERAQLETQAQEMDSEWTRRYHEESVRLNDQMKDVALSSESAFKDAQTRWETEKLTVEQKWHREKADAESRFQHLMEEAKAAWRAEKDELNHRWTQRISEAEVVWADEKASIETAWSARLEELEVQSRRKQDALRDELRKRIEHVSSRLRDVAQGELLREKMQLELSLKVDQLKNTTDAEFIRRVEVEEALHEASTIYKRGLEEKNKEIENLHTELSLSGSALNLSSSALNVSVGSGHRTYEYRPALRSAPRPAAEMSATLALPHVPSTEGGSPSRIMSSSVEHELRTLRQAREDFEFSVRRDSERRRASMSPFTSPHSSPSKSTQRHRHYYYSESRDSRATADDDNLAQAQASLSEKLDAAMTKLGSDEEAEDSGSKPRAP